jgi:hypothetical protein
MKHASLVAGLVALTTISLLACESSHDSPSSPDGAGASGGNDPSSAGADADVAGMPGSSGGADTSGDADAGSPGAVGGSAGSLPADALPAGTFLYVQSLTADHDQLIARSFETGEERVVTDLLGDGGDGWEIWGHTISPDRTRIVIASLYGPTKADNDTQLATRRLWSLASDGSDFQRLTPVFENTGSGMKGFNISVEDPMFTADGSGVLYDFGNWWYEGTSLEGGSLPWLTSANGGLPTLFPTLTSCTVVNPSVNPVTGEVLLLHSVCVNSADEGLFLYPREGGVEPTQLVARGFGAGAVDPSLETASWVGDGSGFVFVGAIDVMRGEVTESAVSLLAYDLTSGDIAALVIPEPDTYVRAATISADATSIVYCLDHGDGLDLHAIDLTQDPPVDAPITDDGISCSPRF